MTGKKWQVLLLFCFSCSLCACGGTPQKASQAAPAKEVTTGSAAQTQNNIPTVYYSKKLTPESIKKVYAKAGQDITGKVAIKFHRDDKYTETPQGVALLKALQESIPNSTLVETTFGGGQKEATEMQARFKGQGLDFCKIDVLNADGAVTWPIKGGRLLKEAKVAKNLANYDSLVVYAPFRGDAYPGYGAALTNIGVGLQDGKGLVHGPTLNKEPDFFERMAEAGKAVTDHFGSHLTYVTALNGVVASCDGVDKSEPVTLGVLASKDIVAVDRAALDIVFAQKQYQGHDLTKKTGTLLGLYQLEFMHKLGMGSLQYRLVDVDAQ